VPVDSLRGGWAATVVLGVLGLAVAEAPAQAQPPGAESQGHFDQGMALYAARDFRAAARELEAAYAIEPRREILFAQAQATRLAGDCAAAVPLYQRFLATGPPQQQIEATRIAMTRCQEPAVLARDLRPRLAAAPAVIARAAAPPAPVVARPRPPFYRDWKGDFLVGAGLLAGGLGVALMVSAKATDADAHAQGLLGDFVELHQRALRRWRIGLGAVVAGGLAVAAGAGRFLWVSRDGAGVGGRF
jgi:hypothetical protein